MTTERNDTSLTERIILITMAVIWSSMISIWPATADTDLPVNTEHGVRLLELDGGRNFRDLGGYRTSDGRTVKTGHLFRSGVLHGLTAQDYDTIEALDIATVVDLRATGERRSEPTFWQAGPVDVMAWDYEMGLEDGSFLEDFSDPDMSGADAEALMGALYRDMVHQQAPHYRALFDRLADNSGPLLFHCTAGKDRTGIGAALVLTALGVDRDTVIADYTVSERILGNTLAREMSGGDQDADPSAAFLASLPEPAVEALMGTRRSYIEAAFDEMQQRHGSVENYMRDALEVSESELRALRDHYLR